MDDVSRLIESAMRARRHAYAPYSKYQVGAAVLDDSGRIHIGCNVENVSFGLTVCAERNAVAAAVGHGMNRIKSVAVATPGGRSPCGACRQVLAEFGDEFPVFIVDCDQPLPSVENSTKIMLSTLLPDRFNFDA